MATLLDLDELPADVRSELQACAADNGRSVQEEVVGRIVRSFHPPQGRETPKRLPAEFDIPDDEPVPALPPDFNLDLSRPGVRVEARSLGRLPFDPCCDWTEELN